MESVQFLSQLKNRYESLTKTEKQIADYVMQYPSQVLSMSAAALAQQTGTAASAVIRFCRSVGYEGYSEFKMFLAVELSRRSPASYMVGVEQGDSNAVVLDKILEANIKALKDTAARMDRGSFDRVVELLSEAENIYIYGVGTSAGLVRELQHRLMILGFCVHGYTDVVEIRLSTMNLEPGDVVIGISHSGRTMAVVDALEMAREAGVETVCLTSYHASPIARYSNWNLTVFCDETRYPIEASAARIAQTAVVDALVAALSLRRFDTAMARSARVCDLMEGIRYQGRKKK